VPGGKTVEHDLHRRPAAAAAVPDLFACETDLAGELGHLPPGISHVARSFHEIASRVCPHWPLHFDERAPGAGDRHAQDPTAGTT
jgi:hypothetical protein